MMSDKLPPKANVILWTRNAHSGYFWQPYSPVTTQQLRDAMDEGKRRNWDMLLTVEAETVPSIEVQIKGEK